MAHSWARRAGSNECVAAEACAETQSEQLGRWWIRAELSVCVDVAHCVAACILSLCLLMLRRAKGGGQG
jgi:hypothetical protein